MSVLALIVAVLVCVGLLRTLGAAEIAGSVVRTAQGAVATLSDTALSDAEKEAAARAAAARLFRAFVAIAVTGLVALAVPAVLVWAGAAAGLYSLEAAIALATGWPFLLGATAVAVAAWLLLERLA